MKNLDAIAALIDGAIRMLYNSRKQNFSEIFGEENGPYLWDKFVNSYGANESAFICYLDHNNQRKLAKAVLEYAEKNDARAQAPDEAEDLKTDLARTIAISNATIEAQKLEILNLRKDLHHLKEQDGRPFKP